MRVECADVHVALQVPNDSKPLLSVKEHGLPFDASLMCFAPSVKERHHIIITFQLPSLLQQYDRKSDEYISHLIGHEGPGSLLSELRARNWATEVCAGVDEDGLSRNTAYTLMQVQITLTTEGMAAGPGYGLAPVGLFFEYMRMLKAAGPQRWCWDESRRVSDMRFKCALQYHYLALS